MSVRERKYDIVFFPSLTHVIHHILLIVQIVSFASSFLNFQFIVWFSASLTRVSVQAASAILSVLGVECALDTAGCG